MALNRRFVKYQLSKFGRRQFHRVYPYTALNGLDRKLLQYLPTSGGTFLEAGANNGIGPDASLCTHSVMS